MNVIDDTFIECHIAWSKEVFGPHQRTAGVVDHIRKELQEVFAHPEDASEWADLIILAIDGAWRAGHTPQDIIDAVIAKQALNEARKWPDWRSASPDKAIEHVRLEIGPEEHARAVLGEDEEMEKGKWYSS